MMTHNGILKNTATKAKEADDYENGKALASIDCIVYNCVYNNNVVHAHN